MTDAELEDYEYPTTEPVRSAESPRYSNRLNALLEPFMAIPADSSASSGFPNSSDSGEPGDSGRTHNPILDEFQEPDILSLTGRVLSTSDWEQLYQGELLRMFKQRMRLVAVIGLLLLPIFTTFYHFISPPTSDNVYRLHVVLMGVLLGIGVSTLYIKHLMQARFLAFTGYLLVPLGIANVINGVSQTPWPADSGLSAVQFTVLASYIHMLLSILILPFSLWEAIIAASIVTGCVGWGLGRSEGNANAAALAAQAFVLVTTAVLVVCLSYFQSSLRRRAFMSSFELALQSAQLQEASATDALTGGYNRRHIEEVLNTELARAARFQRPLSVVMFDLDNFKAVNDTLGHAAGDSVLRVIHDAACAALRDVDTIARFGGDEFLILLPETDAPAARGVAQRLRTSTNAALRDAYGSRSLQTNVTLSMGVLTLHQEEPIAVRDAISRVDSLLYEAKRNGKNRVAVG